MCSSSFTIECGGGYNNESSGFKNDMEFIKHKVFS
jgi:hypothetical protein